VTSTRLTSTNGKHNLVLSFEEPATSLQAQSIKTMAQWSEIASGKANPPVRYCPAVVAEYLDRVGVRPSFDVAFSCTAQRADDTETHLTYHIILDRICIFTGVFVSW
jgi:hypothetical protein